MRMWATVPFIVSRATGPKLAPGARWRMTSIDSFFRLTGRGDGVTRPDTGSPLSNHSAWFSVRPVTANSSVAHSPSIEP